MNWDYIFPLVLFISMILWVIGWGIQRLLKTFFSILERIVDFLEKGELKVNWNDGTITHTKCHDITEWQEKLQKMHRRAQKAESDLAKLAKSKGFSVSSFHYAIFMVSLADDYIAIQEGENPLIMEKVNGVVVIRNQTNNMLANYISPQWLNVNWRLERVRNQA